MILVLGGTTEGRMAVQVLEEGNHPFFYSTRDTTQSVDLHHGKHITGGMTVEQMSLFCQEHAIRLLVDAAHPFARQLHENVYIVSQRMDIPVVRVERIYPDYTSYTHLIHWCSDYEDACRQLQVDDRYCLLALSGVQTIAKLRSYWETHPQTWFRILNRDVSRQVVQNIGFPMNRICYYKGKTVKDELQLIQHVCPDAILTKESGESGGLVSKLEAAKVSNLPVYIVKRPVLPPSFLAVNGPHGLRRQIENLFPEFYTLHTGVTTGTCAATGALCALQTILGKRSHVYTLQSVGIILPNRETIYVNAQLLSCNDQSAQVEVIKRSGDDPDTTQGIQILVTVNLVERKLGSKEDIIIDGGIGIGRVTLPGLDIPIGEAAINAVPKQMIRDNLHDLLVDWTKYQVEVLIEVPAGKEVASRTFNPKLGIVGGISIVGTSGIIRPFSSEAYVASIKRYIEVAVANEPNHVVLNSGAKSEKKLHVLYPQLHPTAFIQYGNYIGEALRFCATHKIAQVTLGVMIGKAVKLAEGYLDTHSHKVTKNHAFMQQIAEEAGCDSSHIESIGQINMARELWDILSDEEMKRYNQVLSTYCHQYCDPLLPEGELEIIIIAPSVRK